MRLWSIHPMHLDSKGLAALWREGLLAQKVLAGKTKGYKHHPQLYRFRDQNRYNRVQLLSTYLDYVAREADRRGYNFDKSKIRHRPILEGGLLTVTEGQIDYEIEHLRKKLEQRDPSRVKDLENGVLIMSMFELVPGGIEYWEKVNE
jgi:hypothetical protein